MPPHPFPPLLLHSASGESLLDDAVRIADRAKAAGVDVMLELFDDSFHAFPLVPFLPEAQRAVGERFASWVSSRLTRSDG